VKKVSELHLTCSDNSSDEAFLFFGGRALPLEDPAKVGSFITNFFGALSASCDGLSSTDLLTYKQ
jgi:hypothetical protein